MKAYLDFPVQRNQYLITDTNYKLHPEAERFLKQRVAEFLWSDKKSDKVAWNFAKNLLLKASYSIWNHLDHIKIRGDIGVRIMLEGLGFEIESVPSEHCIVYWHKGAKFPRILFETRQYGEVKTLELAVKCDSLEELKNKLGVEKPIEGTTGGFYARCLLNNSYKGKFFGVERRGWRGFIPVETDEDEMSKIHQAYSLWGSRPRKYFAHDNHLGFNDLMKLARKVIDLVGVDMAAYTFFKTERDYWERRNSVARLQKSMQSDVGVAYADDHHTYRCGRKHFKDLINFLELLGFQCRERFYSGGHGWGAQVLSNPVVDVVVFCDVDLLPEEVLVDFAHEELKPLKKLGTIGLWCALHGESIFEAGMHHLEIQCAFWKIERNLAEHGVAFMAPFNIEKNQLYQGFSNSEIWKVDDARLELLHNIKLITDEEYYKFKAKGAPGSVMERLHRKFGWLGFNQGGINGIINKTDPRNI